VLTICLFTCASLLAEASSDVTERSAVHLATSNVPAGNAILPDSPGPTQFAPLPDFAGGTYRADDLIDSSVVSNVAATSQSRVPPAPSISEERYHWKGLLLQSVPSPHVELLERVPVVRPIRLVQREMAIMLVCSHNAHPILQSHEG
jgi:hypothetical protein